MDRPEYEQLLLVDDEVQQLASITWTLRSVGFTRIHATSDGEVARKVLMSHPIGLVVLDLNIPGMSGWQLLRWMREQEVAVPVIILSAVDGSTAEEATWHGIVQARLVKPVSKQKLIKTVEAVLTGSAPACG